MSNSGWNRPTSTSNTSSTILTSGTERLALVLLLASREVLVEVLEDLAILLIHGDTGS